MDNIYDEMINDGLKKASIMGAAYNEEFTLEDALDNIKNSNEVFVESYDFKDDGLHLLLKNDEESYEMILYIDNTYITELFKIGHYIPKDVEEKLQNNEKSLFIETWFNDDNLSSYVFQLKLLTIAMPNMISVLDVSAEKVLSRDWVFMTAMDQLLPSPEYLYSIQAVFDDKDNVWLHTHGLNRCGSIELEVLGATKENFRAFSYVINNLAVQFLETGVEEPGTPIFLVNNIAMTWFPWEVEVVKYIDMIGDEKDRDSHDSPSGVIYYYPSKKDYDIGNYEHLSEIYEELENNPLYFYSTKETERMSQLAIGRFSYFRDRFLKDKEKFVFMAKMGIEVDEESIEQVGDKEHLWFTIKDIDVDKYLLTGELQNEPYGIKDLNKGDMVTKHIRYLTDWIIRTENMDITPDSVYILKYID